MSNDATAVVLTPAVFVLMRKAKCDPVPYLFACAFIANAASFVLPISNPANLVLFGDKLPPLLPWLRTFLMPAGAAILATYFAVRALFWRELKGAIPQAPEELRLSNAGKLMVLGIIGTAGTLLFCSVLGKPLGAPTLITALATILFVTLFDRQAPRAVGRGVAWSVLPLVAGLFVIVEALDSTGGLRLVRHVLDKLSDYPPVPATLTTAFGFATVSNLINNLPVGLIGAIALRASAASGHLANAMLIGIDLGPNLSVTGSLATIIWLIALRRENLHVSAWTFLKVGVIATPGALLLASLVLCLTSA
jgi:arsenical pump membrane protein